MVILLGLTAAVLYGSGDFLGGLATRRAHVLPVLLLASADVPLLIVAPAAQVAFAAVLCACAVLLYLRHDRFELGWMR